MDFLKLARSRRSVRAFKPDPVANETLDIILEAARWAPSAGNLQAWRVKVVTELAEKQRLARRVDDFVPTAPVVLVFCADPAASAARYGRRGAELYAVQDATLACTHAMLAAAAEGLGSCWVGAFDEEAVAAALGLPEGLCPIAIMPMGCPAERPETPPRKKEDELRV